MLEFKVTKINEHLYLIKDPLDVNMYLIVGSDEALLFDTGHGVGDLPAAIKGITDKPLTVVLGHGHIDHANGAYQFERVFMRDEDKELLSEHTSEKFRKEILSRLRENKIKPPFNEKEWAVSGKCNVLSLDVGHVFDLGGVHVEVIDMAAHTGGSIGLLIKEDRILLDSDSANTHCWMFLPQSSSLGDYVKMLERVKELDFDIFYVAHQDFPHDKSYFDRFIKAAKNATMENSEPYNALPEENPRIYTEDDVSIVFNERTLGKR